MSQIYKDRASGPVPPTVATTYVTDVNSPAIPAANVLNVFGNDTSINNANGIRTDGSSGSNTLTVQLTNRVTGTGTAIGAVTADLITFDLGASVAVYRFSIVVAGRVTAGTIGDGVGYTIDGSIRTDGAAATVISTPDIDADEDASVSGALISFIASGNNMIVRATGAAGSTITYNAVGTYIVI